MCATHTDSTNIKYDTIRRPLLLKHCDFIHFRGHHRLNGLCTYLTFPYVGSLSTPTGVAIVCQMNQLPLIAYSHWLVLFHIECVQVFHFALLLACLVLAPQLGQGAVTLFNFGGG